MQKQILIFNLLSRFCHKKVTKEKEKEIAFSLSQKQHVNLSQKLKFCTASNSDRQKVCNIAKLKVKTTETQLFSMLNFLDGFIFGFLLFASTIIIIN